MRTGLPVLAIVCLLALSVSTASAQDPLPLWSGTLSYSEGLDALGDWAVATTVLSWDVTPLDSGMWRYAYDLTVPKKDISHFILQTSTNLTSADIYNVTGTFVSTSSWAVGPFDTETGSSNPDMPDSIYGIKFDLGGDYMDLAFSFDCWRDPVWGDFYAKDGKSQDLVTDDEVVAQLWNAGFTEPDWDPPFGDYPAGSGSVAYHVLTPDTTSSSGPPDDSPEPATWLLLAVTGVATGIARRRRK